jgi:hypothetical protein
MASAMRVLGLSSPNSVVLVISFIPTLPDFKLYIALANYLGGMAAFVFSFDLRAY